jgi:hypothetical protein
MNMKTLLAFLVLSGMVEITVAQSQTTNAPPATNAIPAKTEAAVVQMWIKRLKAEKKSPAIHSTFKQDQKVGKSVITSAPEGSGRGGGEGGFDSDLKNIEQLAAKWTSSNDEADFTGVAVAVQDMAKERGILSKVTIETSRGEGALVKYQTELDRKTGNSPTTCKQPSKVVEQIPLGACYIWSEREGKTTSSTSLKFNLAAPEERVVVPEVRLKSGAITD